MIQLTSRSARSRPSACALALLALPLAGVAPAPVELDEEALGGQVEAYLAETDRSSEGRTARAGVLAEVDRLAPEPLTKKEAAAWRERILERWMDGPELEKKTGRHRFWEEEKRGLYIVDGKTKRPKGLLIGMHGGGVGSGDAGEAASFLGSAAGKYKLVAIFPEVLEKTEHGWTTSGTEEWVIDLVDAARRTYGVDPNRVYFAGHSMGGYGSWTLGAHHADRVAALGPAAGAPTPYLGADGLAEDIIEGIVPNLRNVPMRVYQSDDDPQVPVDANRVAAQKVEEARERWGGYEDFEYIEVRGKGHAYPQGGGKKWLGALVKYEREPHPETVVWQPTLAWKRQFYWLWWEAPQLRRTVVAEAVKKENRVRVTCDGSTQGLWVCLPETLFDLEREVTVEVNGAEVWTGLPERRLSTLLLTGARGDEDLAFAARVPAFERVQ